MKDLYYIESVRQFEESTMALLQYIPKNIKKWELANRDFKWYVRKLVDPRWKEVIREGTYVYALGNEEYQIANEDLRVSQIRMRYGGLVDSLVQTQRELPQDIFDNISILYTYHINVGHGNHSLIVFKVNNRVHIWMVDCSDYDFVSHRYYRANIDNCLKYIKQKFQLVDPIHIDVVMLTHPHYDHYSGINYYIYNKLIDKHTVAYVNLKYHIASHNYNNLLSNLNKLGLQIVEPFSCNSNKNIRILYPDIKTFNIRLSPNNISSVYNIWFDNQSYFVFPGDLEQDGWKLMDVTKCYPYMTHTHYYAISHHGSINGHLRPSVCPYKKRNNIKDCLCQHTVPVLMGRDKAFSGIYSSQVLADFNGRILYSEKDASNTPCSFLEIDLIANKWKWY
jgi:hypothetical protein